MIIDIQFAHEHLSGVLKLDRIKKLNLDKIESFDELASMPPDEKMRIKNFIYNNVIIVYGVQHNDGIIPESKIKVIAKDNNKRNIWWMIGRTCILAVISALIGGLIKIIFF